MGTRGRGLWSLGRNGSVDPHISQLGGPPKPAGPTPPRAGVPSAQPLPQTQRLCSRDHRQELTPPKRSVSPLVPQQLLLGRVNSCPPEMPTFPSEPRNQPARSLVKPPFSYMKTTLSCPASSIPGPGGPVTIPFTLSWKSQEESERTREGPKHKANIY